MATAGAQDDLKRATTAELTAVIPELAGQVFDLLSGGREDITFEDFSNCATCLAELSGDFEVSGFEAVDLNGDNLIQRSEFLEEVLRLAGLLGSRKASDALRDIHAGLQKAEADHTNGIIEGSESESNEEEDGERAGGPTPAHATPGKARAGARGKAGARRQPRGGARKKEASKGGRAPKPREFTRAPPIKAAAAPAAPAAARALGPPSNPTVAAASLAARASGAQQRRTANSRPTVRCEKTLEFGKPIRSAICLQNEVWTVDWQGSVTIRDRDDASKVVGEIATRRFVWSMLHMRPGLMWMGQEAHGIALFDTRTKRECGHLPGGHSGGIHCMCVDDGSFDEDAEEVPQRRVWTGSNDFTIREWWVLTWRADQEAPAEVSRTGDSPDNVMVELGPWNMGIVRGRCLHGHTNGVRALLKIGPTVWSGSDDGTIRLWGCMDGNCLEVVEEAHAGSVLKLAIVRASVWSAGTDGFVREWALTGRRRTCTRQVAPPGSEKGIYAILPLNRDVWVAGHHPMIQVFSPEDMQQVSEEEGHRPYISNLIAVDTVESKIVWSTSFGDRKLKVWRHTTRGEQLNTDELKAANLLFQEEEQKQAERIGNYEKKVDKLEQDALQAQEYYSMQMEDAAMQIANAKEQCKSLKKKKGDLEKKLGNLQQALKDHGLAQFADDPEGLKAFLERSAGIEEILRNLGLDKKDLGELAKILGAAQQFAAILEKHGLGSALDDPSVLDGVLDRYDHMKQAFEDRGFSEAFEDPVKLEAFLDEHGQLDALQAKVSELEHIAQDAQAQVEALSRELAQARADDASMDEKCSQLQDEVDALKNAFRDTLLGGLLNDPERLKSFLDRAAKLEKALREKGLEHLLENPEDIAAKLALLQSLVGVMKKCGFEEALEKPPELEKALNRYNALKKVFEDRGYPQLFQDPKALDVFLESCGALEVLKRVLEATGLSELLKNPDKLQAFLQGATAAKKVMDSLGLGHLLQNPDELRQALENAVAFKALEGAFGALGLADLLTDPEAMADYLERNAAAEKELPSLRERAARTDALEKRMADREAELFAKNAKLAAAAESEKKASEMEGRMAQLMDELSELRVLKDQGEKMKRLREILEEYGFDDLLEDPEALEALLEQLAGLRDALSGLGMEDLLDDPEELGRQLELLRQFRSILERYGFPDAAKDPSLLVEVLSRYTGLKQACEEKGFPDIFDDPYTMKGFLRNYARLREEFRTIEKEYLMDAPMAMRDFLKQKLDNEKELAELRKKVSQIPQLEKLLNDKEAMLGSMGSKLGARSDDIEELRGLLNEYERIGSVDEVRQWKEDAAELDRVTRAQDKLHGMISDMEEKMREKERERDEAVERERLMAVKYKELDIFKLDIIARELRGLDTELGTLGRQAKELQADASRLKDYSDQQRIGNRGDAMLDDCRHLRSHIRDVIHKCLSETQKMHIGVAIDDHLAAGELQEGGSMFRAVYEEIERPDHGHSKAARLRQQDERRRK